jgi:hypothetical protein
VTDTTETVNIYGRRGGESDRERKQERAQGRYRKETEEYQGFPP